MNYSQKYQKRKSNFCLLFCWFFLPINIWTHDLSVCLFVCSKSVEKMYLLSIRSVSIICPITYLCIQTNRYSCPDSNLYTDLKNLTKVLIVIVVHLVSMSDVKSAHCLIINWKMAKKKAMATPRPTFNGLFFTLVKSIALFLLLILEKIFENFAKKFQSKFLDL